MNQGRLLAAFLGAATVALVYNDEVEEIGSELLVCIVVVAVGQTLIE